MPMTALFAAMLPIEVMDQIHHGIGMGPLPEGAIVAYLARSTSMFYAFHGALLWYIASDLRKYGDLFRYYLWLSFIFACGLFLTDLTAGLPLRWVLAEGPAVAACVGLMRWLYRVAEAKEKE